MSGSYKKLPVHPNIYYSNTLIFDKRAKNIPDSVPV